MSISQTRAPKQIGDFGEGLATYTLILKGYEIAYVDHVGADLIAEKNGKRFAISVKTRMFKAGSIESRVFVVEESHLNKLDYFANQFGMDPVFALVISILDEDAIHLVMMRVDELRKFLPKVDHGYSFRFSPKRRDELISMPFVDYSCWRQEKLGNKEF